MLSLRVLLTLATLCVMVMSAMACTWVQVHPICDGNVLETFQDVDIGTCEIDCCPVANVVAVNLYLDSGGVYGRCDCIDGCGGNGNSNANNVVSAKRTNVAVAGLKSTLKDRIFKNSSS